MNVIFSKTPGESKLFEVVKEGANLWDRQPVFAVSAEDAAQAMIDADATVKKGETVTYHVTEAPQPYTVTKEGI